MAPVLTTTLRKKAKALIRCAVHYNSPYTRDGSLSIFHRLRSSRVCISDSISKHFTIVQYGESITTEKRKATFHLDDSGDDLKLYVSKDEDERELCFLRQIPRGLMKYLTIFEAEAEAVLAGVFNSRSSAVADAVLRDAGVVEVSDLESFFDDTGPIIEQEGRPTTVETTETTPSIQPNTETPSHSTISDSSDINIRASAKSSDPIQPLSAFRSTPTPSLSSTGQHQKNIRAASPRLTTPSPSIPESRSASPSPSPDTPYRMLLDRLITATTGLKLPYKGTDSIVIGNRDVSFASTFPNKSADQDRKIEAAGELLIFQFLTNLNLPSFNRTKWKSTIRTEVCIHDRFSSLTPWRGSETADIVYHDLEGALTQMFVDKGYLTNGKQVVAAPTYYLEVKTTTPGCDEPFYMSGAQYNRASPAIECMM